MYYPPSPAPLLQPSSQRTRAPGAAQPGRRPAVWANFARRGWRARRADSNYNSRRALMAHRAATGGGRAVLPRAARRGGRRRKKGRFKTPLTPTVILLWAQDHLQRTGQWPTVRCGQVLASPEESWFNI